MAERVDAIPPWDRWKGMYPWDEWFDGSVWELARGKDFNCQPESVRRAAIMAGDKRSVRVRIAIRSDRVYIQAQRDN